MRELRDQMISSNAAGRYRANTAYLSACLGAELFDEFAHALGELQGEARAPAGNDMRLLLRSAVQLRHAPSAMLCMRALLDGGDVFDPLPAFVLLANAGAFNTHPAEAERLVNESVRLVRPRNFISLDILHVLQRIVPLLGDTASKMWLMNVTMLCNYKSRDQIQAIKEIASGGQEAVDDAYLALERFQAEGKVVSVGAINSVIQMCGLIDDLDRASQTFEAISGVFGLDPDASSYSAMLEAASRARDWAAVDQILEQVSSAGIRYVGETYRHACQVRLRQRKEQVALELFDQARAANLARGGTYALFICYFMGENQYGVRGRKKPDLARAAALAEEAVDKGLRVRSDIIKRARAAVERISEDVSEFETAAADGLTAATTSTAAAPADEAAAR